MEAFFFFLFRPAYGNTIPTSICSAFANARRNVYLNAVGYQTLSVTNQYSFKTFTFRNIDTSKKLDLLDIKPMFNNNGVIQEFPATGGSRCYGAVKLQSIAPGGKYLTQYKYYSTKKNGEVIGWSADSGSTSVLRGEVEFENGEGFLLYSDKADGVALLQISGQVDTEISYPLCNQYSFAGNATPLTVDLLDFIPKYNNGTEITDFPATGGSRCYGAVKVQKILPGGKYTTQLKYYSTKKNGETIGWSADSGTTSISRGTVTFEPGEGFIVYSDKADDVAVLTLSKSL